MSIFKFKSTCIMCNKKFKSEPGIIDAQCYECKHRMYGVSAVSEMFGTEYIETRWENGKIVMDTHGAGKDGAMTAIMSGEYQWELKVKNDGPSYYGAVYSILVNGSSVGLDKIAYLHDSVEMTYKGTLNVKAGDKISLEIFEAIEILSFAIFRNRPSFTYEQPLTDPVQFSGGSWIRRGEYMIIYSNNRYFDRKPIYDFLPAGFDYDMNSLTFIPTDDNKVKMQIRVKGWVNAFQMSETIKFEPPKEDLSAYKISGQFTINTPGTYEINGRKITLHDGSISVELNNSDVNEDGTIKSPVKFQEKGRK